MSDLSNRISQVIDTLGLKKTVFAERLNVSQAFVSQMCSGASQPSDRTIADICRKFDVDEEWLRTGEGDMFIQKTRDEELSAFFGEIMAEEHHDFRQRFISALARLSADEWELLESMANKLLDEMQKEKADP